MTTHSHRITAMLLSAALVRVFLACARRRAERVIPGAHRRAALAS